MIRKGKSTIFMNCLTKNSPDRLSQVEGVEGGEVEQQAPPWGQVLR